MGLNDDDVREILRIIDESDLDELSIETEGFALHVRKGSGSADARSEAVLRRTPSERASATPDGPAPERRRQPMGSSPSPRRCWAPSTAPRHPGRRRSSRSGAGRADTTVCIIEVMKMMNSVPAGVSGTIAEIVPENGQLVEYGDPLFRVKPEE